MKKIAGLALVAMIVVLPALASAAPWAVVTSYFSSPVPPAMDDREGIFTVDLGASPPRFYGPFLQGVFTKTSGSMLFDVAVLPNGYDVLVSNFADQKVHRVDFSDPRNPFLKGTLKMQWNTGTRDPVSGAPIVYKFFAEDIAVSPDGTLAIVSDGGFAPYLGFIDLIDFKLKKIQKTAFPHPTRPDTEVPLLANAVEIAPDGKTVLFADYFLGKVHSALLNDTRDGVYGFHHLFLCDDVDPADKFNCLGIMGRPVNVSVTPDSRTVLAALADARKGGFGATGRVAVLTIDPIDGTLAPGSPLYVAGLPGRDGLTPDWPDSPGGNQSIAILPGGNQAFVITQPLGAVDDPDSADPADMVNRYNLLAKLRIVGPGMVELVKAKYKTLRTRGTSQLFGVDTLGASADGQWLIAANPTVSGGTNVLTFVNTRSGDVGYVELPDGSIPTGVGFLK